MWRGILVLSGVLATLAVAKENPYQSIIDRNAFGLKPPPPPPTNIVEVAPLLQVKLTGVSSLGGEPKAFFQMTEPGPGKLPKWPPGLTKGEKLDGIEVLDIDVDKAEVRIKNGTIETTLNFEKDGIKSAPGAAVPPRTALVPPLTLPAVRPSIPGFGSTLTNLATPNPAIANRSVTVTGGAGTPGAGGVTVSGGAGNPYGNMSDELRRRYGLPGADNGAAGSGVRTSPGAALQQIPTRQLRVTPNADSQKEQIPRQF